MKYVITGSLGNIGKPLTTKLLAAGHDVTVVSSHADRTPQITALGAKAAVGTIEDVNFLTNTFKGADVIFTMVPPKWDAANWKAYIRQMGKNYADAIKAAGVKKVVNLSSTGAHMPDGCGPVSGLYGVEQTLDAIGVDVRHIRPGFFYTNLLSNISMIKTAGIIGGNYGDNTKLVLVHPTEIAQAVSEEMQNPVFKGVSIRYVASDECTTNEIAATLGKAIGQPQLPWINFADADAQNGMLQSGLSLEVARNYVEMGVAVRNGEMFGDYFKHKPALGKVKLENFAQDFAAAFSQQA
jgi:uncharacterized protein YbjT (DUF2867 family)